jgi:Family of unknown function (DUF6504)
MAHRYRLPIRVRRGPDGAPHRFTWRGEQYRVQEVLGTWHLCDRWWQSPVAAALGTEAQGPSDRHYYRLLVPEQQVFEVYYDTVSHTWVLDVVQD